METKLKVRDIRKAIHGISDDSDVLIVVGDEDAAISDAEISIESIDPIAVTAEEGVLKIEVKLTADMMSFPEDDGDDSMDGDHETALRDAGLGTDEDYGYFGDAD